MKNNPVLFQINKLIDFQAITEDQITEATAEIQAEAQRLLQHIFQREPSYENTLQTYDRLNYRLGGVYGVLSLLANVSPQDAIRLKAYEAVQELEVFMNALQLNEELYQAFKRYEKTPEAQKLEGYKAKFLRETVADFERSGFALPAAERKVLENWQNELSRLTNEFQKNIAEYQDFILLEETQTQGLPKEYLAQHRTENGQYKITLDSPSFQPFMQMAESEADRKTLYIKYLNRSKDTNLSILQAVLLLRKQIANLLGFQTFAQYRLSGRMMAKLPSKVWDFETELTAQVRPKAQADYAELLEVKNKRTGQKHTQLNAWEKEYFQRFLLKEKYSVDTEKVKEYFELDSVIGGLFQITEKLFGVQIQEKQGVSVWQEEVRYFEVIENQQVIGRFYLDLFPRPNKYGHAACFPMIAACQTSEGWQEPVLALVCNFPKPSSQQPSLLRHGEVETLFHEFGHALHCLLSTSKLASYAGTSTARDFVEVPSQLFENWAWQYESLKLFAKHYQTQEILPKEMFEKMWLAKNVGSGIHTLQQVFYGSYDLALHDRYDPENQTDTTVVLKQLQSEISLFPYLENTHFQAGFGHLMGYEASYYGYMWALVFAEDAFSVFEKNGILNPEFGKKYRETILAKGGSEDEEQLLIDFLGRKPNNQAFLKSLGL